MSAPMNEPIPPTRPGTGVGCFGKGCLVVALLLLFLVVAFVGGGFWALHHLRKSYSATEPLTFPNTTFVDAPVRAVVPEEAPVLGATGSAPVPDADDIAELSLPAREVDARWRAFEKAANRHEPARVELSADEINTLISDGRRLRGKAFVTIENNIARLRVSIPLDRMFLMHGRYLNAEATIEPAPDGDPAKARFSNIKFGDKAVSEDMLDRRLFGWSSIRGYVNQWLDDKEIVSFKIENNRVIGQSGGSR